MRWIFISLVLAVLPPQKVSPVPSVALPPVQSYTRALLYWAQDPSPEYLYTEIWHTTNGVDCQIYDYCTYTNYIVVPMDVWYTRTNAVLDTNDNFAGWQTNQVSMDLFWAVDCEMRSRRITNYTWIEPLP